MGITTPSDFLSLPQGVFFAATSAPAQLRPARAVWWARIGRFAEPLAVYLGLLLLTLALQWAGGAWVAELNGYPDEPAHYVSTLMVADYVRGGLSTPPLTYAAQYYLHFPKVAIGQWPPVFYAIGALWMILIGESRLSMLILSAAITATWALLTYRIAAFLFSRGLALLLAVLLIAAPTVQWSTALIMSDVLTALLTGCAVAALVRYLETSRALYSGAFGVLASLAILTKGSAGFLALMPLFMLLATRRWSLLRQGAFWLPVPIVALLAMPWHVVTFGMVGPTWVPMLLSDFVKTASVVYAGELITAAGAPLGVLAVAGVWVTLGRRTDRPRHLAWTALAGMIVTVFAFQCLTPCAIETRYMLPAFPAIILFAGAGAVELLKRSPFRVSSGLSAVLLLALLFTIFGPAAIHRKPAADDIYAASVAQRYLDSDAAILVSGPGEGSLIAEVAQRDEARPSMVTLRATKVLSKVNWMGNQYELTYATGPALLQALENMGVGVICAASPERFQFPHEHLLAETIEAHPERFRPLHIGRTRVYEFLHAGVIEPDFPDRHDLLPKVNSSLLGRLHRRAGRIVRQHK